MKAVKRFGLVITGLLTTMALVLPGASANAGPAAPQGERYVGRIDTMHMFMAETNLVIYGAYQLGALGATFNQERMPSYISQTVLPYIRIPDGARHTYRFECKVEGHGPAGTNTVYRFNNDGALTTTTVGQGTQTLTFVLTRDLDSPNGGWVYWGLDNVSGHIWTWRHCEAYERLS